MARSGPHVRQPTSRMAPGSMEIRPTGLHRHPERRKASLQELIARAQRVRTRRDGAVEVDQRVVLVVLGPRWQAGPVRVAGLGMRTRFLPPPRASLGSGHICRRESDCRVAGSDLCPGRQAHVPLLAGWNRDEFSFQSRGRIDQAEGWTNIQALQISRYGQQKIAETAVEYLLGATDSVRQRFALQQSEQRDQSLRDEAHSIADRVRSTLLRFGWDINWSGAGTISSILKRWSSVYQHITSLDGWPTSGRTATDECPIFADVYTILAPTPVHLPLLGYLILKR